MGLHGGCPGAFAGDVDVIGRRGWEHGETLSSILGMEVIGAIDSLFLKESSFLLLLLALRYWAQLPQPG